MLQTKNNSPNQNNSAIEKQIKFAVVMYGGGSLAIYINGVAQELLRLAQATAPAATNFKSTSIIYRKIAFLLSDANFKNQYLQLAKQILSLRERISESDPPDRSLKQELKNKLAEAEELFGKNSEGIKPSTCFVIDVLTGSSAGGINSIYLSKALVNGLEDMNDLQRLWLEQGDFAKLLNDKKSVADNNLPFSPSPASLLNSQRMYLELLKALDGMDEKAENKNSLVEQLDLYVTYTDFKGVPLPMQLFDKTVLERRHRQVFNFRYLLQNQRNRVEILNDFKKTNNPFLAFAARSTSAFPLAFEASRLTDIDEVIDSSVPQYVDGKSDNPAWRKYFRELTDESGEKVIWENRSFVDGGALDNKPFGYAIDKLTERTSEGIVERKLLYIEPAPEEFNREKDPLAKPDALENVLAQASGLPRYETIREDLQRVHNRNRLINRVRRITTEVEADFEEYRDKLQPKDLPNNIDWSEIGLEEVIEYKGKAFLLYYRLRVSALTDELARLATSYFRIDEDSDYSKVLRCLIRIWRENNFRENKRKDSDGNKIETDQTLNKFLYLYDVDYRLRRLRFVIQKAEYLLRCKDAILNRLSELCSDDAESEEKERKMETARSAHKYEQGVLSNEAVLLYALWGSDEQNETPVGSLADKATMQLFSGLEVNDGIFVEQVKNIQRELNEIYSRLRREREFLQTSLNNPLLAEELLKGETYGEQSAKNLSELTNAFRGVEETLQRLELAKQKAKFADDEKANEKALKKLSEIEKIFSKRKEARNTLTKQDQTELQKLSFAALERILSEIKRNEHEENCSLGGDSRNNGAREDNKDFCKVALENAYGEEQLNEINSSLKIAADKLNDLYNPANSFLSRVRSEMTKTLEIDPNPIIDAQKISNFIRKYLKKYYLLFDSYDQISFPVYFETPVGEAVEVDIVRISSRDAHSLINEEDKNEKRRKLAGDYLYAFGAFLDPRWRLNDIMWGRLDGAERLIETLLPGLENDPLRKVLIREANETILNEVLVSKATKSFKTTLVTALTFAGTEAIGEKAVDKLVQQLTADKIKTPLSNALTTCLEPDQVCDEVTGYYEVDRRLEPQPTLRLISRSTQVVGKILEGISKKSGQEESRLNWISKLGRIFWGLIEVAVPNSTFNLLFFYWLQLLYLFEVILIVGGTLLVVSQVQQFGIVAFVLTVTIHLTVLTLHDNMRGKDFFKLLRWLFVFPLMVLLLAGFFALYALLYDHKLLDWAKQITERRTNSYEIPKLIPFATLAVLVYGLLLWREVRNKSIRFFGLMIWVLFGVIIIVTLRYFGLPEASGIDGLKPLLSLEFLQSVEDIKTITGNGAANDKIKLALLLDSFVIVPIYVALFLLMSQLLALRQKRWFDDARRKSWKAIPGAFFTGGLNDIIKKSALLFAWIAAILALLGGIGDCLENAYSYLILDSPRESFLKVIVWSSHIKFALLFTATIILSLVFWRLKFNQPKSRILRNISLSVFGLLFVGLGALGLTAIARQSYELVELVMNLSFVMLPVAGTIFILLNKEFLVDS